MTDSSGRAAARASPDDRISRAEIRATLSLSSLFALRMLGLFIILPVFAVHARTHLAGGESQVLIGIALGAYGLTQGALQIPYGMASDRYGRKRTIIVGLVLFALGSFIAAAASHIWLIILGRVIQGTGAISAPVVAFAADLTREQHRTKAMALIGASIGLMFALSLVAAPALYQFVGMGGIFLATGLLSLAGIWVTLKIVPPEPEQMDLSRRVESAKLGDVLRNPDMLRLNLGIFCLHMVQMAMFVVVPVSLVRAGLPLPGHWKVYLPVVLLSFALMIPPIIMAERRGRMKLMFVSAVALMLAVQVGFAFFGEGIVPTAALLLLFFVAFNVLEASLPSLVSRVAPSGARGTAIGVYNTTQSLGLFVGGFAGGVLSQVWGNSAVFVFGAAFIALWLFVAFGMRAPGDITTRRFALGVRENLDELRLEDLRERLVRLKGIRDVVFMPEEGAALVTFFAERWDEQAAMELLRGKH